MAAKKKEADGWSYPIKSIDRVDEDGNAHYTLDCGDGATKHVSGTSENVEVGDLYNEDGTITKAK